MTRVSRICLLLFASTLCVIMLEAAPAPQSRRPARTPTGHVGPGRWLMQWDGGEWRVNLYPGGGYSAELGGLLLAGGYTWDHFSRTFVIRERLARGPQGGAYCVYEVRLDGELCGRATCGARVRLQRIR